MYNKPHQRDKFGRLHYPNVIIIVIIVVIIIIISMEVICVCVRARARAHTHTHTHTYIYIYIYRCKMLHTHPNQSSGPNIHLYNRYWVPFLSVKSPGHGVDHPHLLVLTYSMEQSPSWEANWFSASQEIPRILWNLKVHYHIHKCPIPVPILSQLNPVQTPHPTS